MRREEILLLAKLKKEGEESETFHRNYQIQIKKLEDELTKKSKVIDEQQQQIAKLNENIETLT